MAVVGRFTPRQLDELVKSDDIVKKARTWDPAAAVGATLTRWTADLNAGRMPPSLGATHRKGRHIMKIYELHYNARPPEGIEERQAHIIGGGMAGLSAALFLTEDCHLPGENVHIYEKLPALGGSMDGTAGEMGYLCRGERELEPYMECFWYLWSKVPSLRNPGRTVLDDVVDFNRDNPIHSEYRLLENRGQVHEVAGFGLDDELAQLMNGLFFVPEHELEGVSIEQYFPERFFTTNLWYGFHTMLAFKRYHSVIEAKRYFRRFSHLNEVVPWLHGILHTDLNEYDALIKPLLAHLRSKGVQMHIHADVKEIQLTPDNNTVTGIDVVLDGERTVIGITPTDMVLFTNGSMSQNARYGDNTTVAPTDRDTDDLGVFSVWQKLAERDPKFGNPATFISDVDKTKWVSFFPTIKGYPDFIKRLEEVSGSKAGNGGIISFIDSSWDMSIILHHKPFFEDQPDDVEVFWGYGLYGENVGDYVKKPMSDCTGNEILAELLYHLGMLDMYDDLVAHSYVSTCMMPYITSQFMPRKIADRPHGIPQGCTNLAFMGQYVETEEDAVFTVETSVRTAMAAAYRLTGIEKDPVEVYPTFYDLRYIATQLRLWIGKDTVTVDDLPKIDPDTIEQYAQAVVGFLNNIPRPPSAYPGKENAGWYHGAAGEALRSR
ncbi:oleate hydratase [Nocardia sp. NPDC059240]|uniref:oleate hydratase n=1 Tax=Nocardia sp. NPDC059240 TaxID=3346786 RepID=UPI00368002F5